MSVLRRSVGPPGPPDDGAEAPGPEDEAASSERPSPPPIPPPLKRFLRRGVFLYPVVVAALWAFSDLGIWDALFLGALLELLPVLAVAQVPLVSAEAELDRPAAYVGSAGAILVLGWLAFFLGRGRMGLEPMGLGAVGRSELLLWSAVALAGGLALVGLFHLLERLLGLDEPPLLRKLLPRTRGEKVLFVGVSLAAGFGEELAYRGYAIPVMAGLLGSEWGAAVFSSGIFGFLHAYQGRVGVVRTGLMGLVLAGVFLLSGSLWPAIAAHVAIDLIGGLVIGPRMLERS